MKSLKTRCLSLTGSQFYEGNKGKEAKCKMQSVGRAYLRISARVSLSETRPSEENDTFADCERRHSKAKSHFCLNAV